MRSWTPANRCGTWGASLCALIHTPAASRTPQGTLAQLDSRNPLLYLEGFPGGGRLRLRGTLAFPRARFAVMKVPTGSADVAVEDVFENVVG